MPIRTDIPPACRTCRWWAQRFPGNARLGVCTKGSLLPVPGQHSASIVIRTDDSYPEIGVDRLELRTLDEFGCRGHSDYLSMRYQSI